MGGEVSEETRGGFRGASAQEVKDRRCKDVDCYLEARTCEHNSGDDGIRRETNAARALSRMFAVFTLNVFDKTRRESVHE